MTLSKVRYDRGIAHRARQSTRLVVAVVVVEMGSNQHQSVTDHIPALYRRARARSSHPPRARRASFTRDASRTFFVDIFLASHRASTCVGHDVASWYRFHAVPFAHTKSFSKSNDTPVDVARTSRRARASVAMDATSTSEAVDAALRDVYAACERVREALQENSLPSDVRRALDGVELRARAARAMEAPREALEAMQRTVRATVEAGERATWTWEVDARERGREGELVRDVTEELDRWAEEDERRRAKRREEDVCARSSSVRAEEASRVRDGARALRELERATFSRRAVSRREPLNGEDEARERGRKKREEVLLKIDETLASITDEGMEGAVTVASNLGDGSAKFVVGPVVGWLTNQSTFLRASVAVVLVCTFFAIVLIEFLVDERSADSGAVTFNSAPRA